MNYIDTVRYRYDDGTTDVTYTLENRTIIEMDAMLRDNDATNDDYPSYYCILPPDSTDATGYIQLDKKMATAYGKLYIRYFKKMTDLESVIDETLVPIPSILEDFAISYIYKVKGDESKAKLYDERFWGPPAGRGEIYKNEGGLRLLEIMQANKGEAIGQPKSLKTWRGRAAIKSLFNESSANRDYTHERYF